MDVLVNFAENGNLGCDSACPFCPWRRINYGVRYVPTDSELDLVRGGSVKISGGGDPLYHYEKNKAELFHITDYLTAKGMRVGLLSRAWQTIIDNWDEITTHFKYFSLSVPDEAPPVLRQLLQKCRENGIPVHVSVVLTDDDERIKRVIAEYSNFSIRPIFRDNWNNPLGRERLSELRQQYPASFRAAHLKFPVLWDGQVMYCYEVDERYLFKK